MTGRTGPRRGGGMIRGAMLAVLAVLLAGCSNQTETGPTPFGIARQALGQATAGLGGKEAPTARADTPEAMAARALAANPAPLIMAQIGDGATPQVLVEVGRNGTMRTYMNPAKQALILRDGLLSGTRGFGHDLSVAEPGSMAGLIRARQTGSGTRVMRYLSGDGVERPLPLTCTIRLGEAQTVSFAGRSWQTRQVHEACTGPGTQIQNSYLVTADGQIPASHQWIGPGLGHVTLQVVRP